MAPRRRLSVILPMTAGIAILVSTFAMAQDAAMTAAVLGDPERGKAVYQKVGFCTNCHGWAGDGGAGRNPMARGGGVNIRKTGLDAEGLAEVIRCGIPGTAMPYHDSAAYRDDRCYGMVMSDFEPEGAPVRGKTFREKQLADLVAYLQANVIGPDKPTLEQCAAFYGESADKSCAYLVTD